MPKKPKVQMRSVRTTGGLSGLSSTFIANIGGVIPGFCLFLVLNELRHQFLGDRQ